MGKINGGATGRGSPHDNATDLPPRSGHKRPRSQLSNGGQQRSYPPSPPHAQSRPVSWPPLYLGAAGGGSGAGGLNGAPLNLSESLYGYASSPHQSNRFSQVISLFAALDFIGCRIPNTDEPLVIVLPRTHQFSRQRNFYA